MYSVTINGVDRTTDIIAKSIVTEANLTDRQDTCHFDLVNRSGLGFPINEQEIIITLSDNTKLFGGILTKTEFLPIKQYGQAAMTINANDYVRLLDSNLVHKNYTNMTDAAIIQDILSTYCSG